MIKTFNCKKPLEILSQEEISAIHNRSLQLLDEIGIYIEDEEILKLLADNGCDVDMEEMVAHFPADLVELQMKKCPDSFTLKSMDRENDMVFAHNQVMFGACSGMKVINAATGELRRGTAVDAAKTIQLTHALDIMAGSNAGLGFISDLPAEINLVWYYALCLKNSPKVFCLASMGDSVKWGLEMAQAAGVDVMIQTSSSSPLGWHKEQIETIKRACSLGLPLLLQSMASPGSTAPVTLAGALALMNAEVLAMAVVAQLLRPGTGIMLSCFSLPMDMWYGTLASGSMELGMVTAASAQLARHNGMHSMVFGPNTDSKSFDPQAGFEKAMQYQLEAMAGINLIWGAGMIDNHSIWSDAQMMVDIEICEMVGRFIEGIQVDDDSMNMDLFRDVGRFPNHYLAHPHTLKHCRTEHFIPSLASRESYDSWKLNGSKNILEKAEEQVEKIMKNHSPFELPKEVDREINRIIAAAAAEKGIDPMLK